MLLGLWRKIIMKDDNNLVFIGNTNITILIIFIVFKLTHVINWSWWWVLSPIWITIGIWFLVMIIVFITLIFASTNIRGWFK